MKKTIIMLAVMMVVVTTVSAQNQVNKTKLQSLTEVFFGADNANTFRTGVFYKNFYLWGQAVEYNRDLTFSAGAAYDNHYKNTYFRLLASYGKEFYGFAMVMQDLGIKYINPQPTLLVDTDLSASIGINIPVQISKNISLGIWATKGIKEANRGGFRLGENKVEIDLYFRF